MEKIRLGISTCLLGENVRFDGGHKLDRYLTDTLGQFVEYVPVCPEMECGFGVPRESFRLVGDPENPRLVTTRTNQDHTERMAEWAKRNLKPEAVVVCRKPTLFAGQSRMKSIQFPAELEVDKFITEAKKRGGEYLVLEEISPELRPILFGFWKSRPERLALEKQISQTYLLRIN